MRNVYDEIASFYKACEGCNHVVAQPLIEGYLRKKAWQGYDDGALKNVWNILGWFAHYLMYAEVDDLNALSEQDYAKVVLWISENDACFAVDEANVQRFFAVMKDFYGYLKGKKVLHELRMIDRAALQFFPNGKFSVPVIEEKADILGESFPSPEDLTDETAEQLNVLLEKLLSKIGAYYKDESFTLDFNRALSLYSGPFNHVPQDDDGEEFWMGFWDYFLFDYHLAGSDVSPLRFFYDAKEAQLSPDEKHIMHDLMRAKFTLFYINRIVDQYMVECVDVLTGEKIRLPIPDYGMRDYKKILLYGHIHSEGIVMLNYITSVSVSRNLRKRIQEEILRQWEVFRFQEPDADMDAFFRRHAIAVRHTIDILVSLAKVNVLLPDMASCRFPSRKRCLPVAAEAVALLESLAAHHKFSVHAVKLLKRMWEDFCDLEPAPAVPQRVAVGSLFLIFSMNNGMSFVTKKSLLQRLSLPEAEVDQCCEKIFATLKLKIFDPRYLTEEGFVLMLYAF